MLQVSVRCVNTRADHLLLDPCASEEDSCSSTFDFSFSVLHSQSNLLVSSSVGEISFPLLNKALTLCSGISSQLDSTLKDCITYD